MASSAPAEAWVARARIALGTLVQIALPAQDATEMRFAAGFAAIDHVHAKMSAHNSESDVARITHHAHRHAVTIDAATYAVLTLALELWRETHGAFDVTIAPLVLPPGVVPRGVRSGRMHALRLLPDLQVRATLPVALDLGGIAKGFAVDRAVDALRAAGASAGRVNAGGDLRVFGAEAWTKVHVRHPAVSSLSLPLFDLQEFAVATSADYFALAPALVDPCSARARSFGSSVTVAAPTCVLADALTKIVALDPMRAPSLLARREACAFLVSRDRDHPRCASTCRRSTAHLRLPAAMMAA